MGSALRSRIAALALAGALQIAAVWLLIHSLIVPAPPRAQQDSETRITLLPVIPPLAPRQTRKRASQAAPSTNAITPYFNPYAFQMPENLHGHGQNLSFALSACDAEKYDMATDEIRAACDRIGMLIRRDPGHFGFSTEVKDNPHWQRELIRRDAPLLAPCMSSGGFDVLYTLTCVYEAIFTGYRDDKRQRYNE